MNSDALKSLIIKVAVMVLTAIATQLHISGGAGDLTALATDLVDAGFLIYGVYRSYGMKIVPHAAVAVETEGTVAGEIMKGSKVNVTGKVVGALLVAFLLSAFLAPGAQAADVAPAPTFPVKAIFTSPTPCVAQNCSGWYAGFGILGDGSNVDVIGNGINGSVFSSGGAIKLQGGYQLWNGSWFAAIDGSVGYEFTTNASASAPVTDKGGSKFIGTELVKLGYNFFPQAGAAVTTPSQSPIPLTVPANLLASSTPYMTFGGMQRRGISEWVNGVGVQTVIAAGWSSDVKYLYAPSQQGVPATSVVMIEINKHF